MMSKPKQKMLLQMQTLMCCRLVQLQFLISLSLVGFSAAKCVPERCGSINVSFPFWVNDSQCGYPGFQITCKNDSMGILSPHLYAFLSNYSDYYGPYFKIMEMDYMGQLVIDSYFIYAYACDPSTEVRNYFQLPLDEPFTLSKSNRLVVIGCESVGTYSFGDLGEARCVSICDLRSNQPYCPLGCCQIDLPDNMPLINFTASVIRLSNDSHTKTCGFATIMDTSTFTVLDNKTILNWGKGWNVSYGLRLNWGIGYGNCSTARAKGEYSCSPRAECFGSPTGKGHLCKCLPGFEGNGYSNGTDCTDVDECRYKWLNKCVGEEGGGICHNLPGSYNCSCGKGFLGDGFRNGTRCKSTSSNTLVLPAIIGSVTTFVVVSVAASFSVWWLKQRHLKQVEAKYFQQLQHHIASTGGREILKIFSAKELEKASNNYSKEMVLGSGGFGTVYKGILPDNSLVAIKKSNQIIYVEHDHEFLNEVTILSQVNHRNIVKLLGCCIQTKYPMLVSEFVPNGTLFEHLQSKEMILSWPSRLQIAIETGEALAYLHSGASQPIFHRDVKSCNILLNENLSPKVADFGISRLISSSNIKTHVSTNNIWGTRGYLDPEYLQTYQLTEKSDVYSFGVVLVELLTGLEPISEERNKDEMNLSTLFLSRLNCNRVREIFDGKVLEEEKLQEMEDMANIARECLHLERRNRPSMKEVVEELVSVRDGKRKIKVVFEERCILRGASQNIN